MSFSDYKIQFLTKTNKIIDTVEEVSILKKTESTLNQKEKIKKTSKRKNYKKKYYRKKTK